MQFSKKNTKMSASLKSNINFCPLALINNEIIVIRGIVLVRGHFCTRPLQRTSRYSLGPIRDPLGTP